MLFLFFFVVKCYVCSCETLFIFQIFFCVSYKQVNGNTAKQQRIGINYIVCDGKISFFSIVYIFNVNFGASAQTQAEMNEKALKKYDQADVELNKVYKQLLKVLDGNEKKMLIKAQKDWLKFRDSHCEFEAYEYDGGSIQPLIQLTCLDEQTWKRIKDLKANLENKKI